MLEMNKPKAPRVISQGDPEFQGITEALLGKRGKVIEGKFGKPFGETITDDIIRDINNMETIPSMKEMNKVIKRDGRYKNLTDKDVDKIFKATEDRTSGRLDDIDPEDMYADGGVAGLLGERQGFANGRRSYSASQYSGGSKKRGMSPGRSMAQFGHAGHAGKSQSQAKRHQKAGINTPSSGPGSNPNMGQTPPKKTSTVSTPKKTSTVSTPKETSKLKKGLGNVFRTAGEFNYLKNLYKLDPVGLGLSFVGNRVGDFFFPPAGAAELTKEDMEGLGFTYKDPLIGSPRFTDPIGEATQKYFDFATEHKAKYPQKDPSGIKETALRFGKTIGAPTKEQMDLLPEGFLATPEDYKIQKSPLELYTPMALGGRVPFAMGRRAFLKLLGVGGAGIAGLKTGVGLGGKKVATEVAKDVATTSGTTPPPYFFNLVNKIKTLGDDAVASQDKAKAYKYKDYTMEEDFAGNIEIKKTNYGMFGDEIAPTEEVYMSYTIDEVPLRGRGKKKSTKVEEYEEYTARPDEDGKMKDVESGVPDDVIEDGTMFEDNITDFGKADGGIARMLGE
jgi:hypothetical protein